MVNRIVLMVAERLDYRHRSVERAMRSIAEEIVKELY